MDFIDEIEIQMKERFHFTSIHDIHMNLCRDQMPVFNHHIVTYYL